MYFNINYKFEIKSEDISDPIVLIGWPGIALVAKLATTSIRDSLDAEEFMSIEYFDFPPKSNVEKGELKVPTAEVYYVKKSGKNTNDFFILTANYQPQSSKGVFEFSQKFCEEMDKVTGGAIKMYVSTGAMISEQVESTPKVHICGTDNDLVKSFLKHKNTKLMENGVIAGANGILTAWAGQKGYAPGVCLLAETLPLPMMALDPRASKALVTILKDYFEIKMNFDELNKQIEEMENIINSYKKQTDHFMENLKQDRGPDSYYR
jgi:proteasome assembly chaperone (PAC2) family protein